MTSYGIRKYDETRWAVTCKTDDGVTADMLITRTKAAANVIAEALNLDQEAPEDT